MRASLLALLALAAPVAVSRAGEEVELTPRCGGPFQLCGYVDKGSGTLRIPERFEVAQPFGEGLAPVRIDGLWGYVDAAGTLRIAPRFEGAGAFTGGYAEVRLDGASGIVDRSGRLVVPARFKRIIPFTGGTFIAEPLPENRPPPTAADVALEGFDGVSPFIGLGAAGLYHIRNHWLTPQDLRFDLFDRPERGLVWAGKRNEHGDEEWGLLEADGTWRVPPRYGHVQRLMETHAIVRSLPDYDLPPVERRETIRSGAVDRDGNLVVPLRFAHLSYWRGGYGTAREGRPYNPDGSPSEAREGIVRGNGALLAQRYFDKVDIREDGSLPRGRIGAAWYSIEPDGRLVPDQLDGRVLAHCPSGLKIIERGDSAEFLRPGDGRTVGRFDNTYFGTRSCAAAISATRGGHWFFVLEDGTVLGGDEGFDTSYGFNEGHAAVEVDGRWGIIDRTGAFTVWPRFPRLRPDRDGTFVVGEGASQYWIDASGTRVERPAVERPDPERALTCKGGLRFFRRAGLWGFRDAAGETVIEPRFRALSCFAQGVSWAAEPGGTAWCPVGPDGERRESLACTETYYPVILTEHSPEKFSDSPYENSVLWTRAWLDHLAGDREEPPKWIPRSFAPGAYTVMPGGPAGQIAGLPAVGQAPAGSLPLAPLIVVLLAGAVIGRWRAMMR